MVDGAGLQQCCGRDQDEPQCGPSPHSRSIYIESPHNTYVGDTKVRARLTIDMLLECTVWARVPHFRNVDSNDRS